MSAVKRPNKCMESSWILPKFKDVPGNNLVRLSPSRMTNSTQYDWNHEKVTYLMHSSHLPQISDQRGRGALTYNSVYKKICNKKIKGKHQTYEQDVEVNWLESKLRKRRRTDRDSKTAIFSKSSFANVRVGNDSSSGFKAVLHKLSSITTYDCKNQEHTQTSPSTFF